MRTRPKAPKAMNHIGKIAGLMKWLESEDSEELTQGLYNIASFCSENDIPPPDVKIWVLAMFDYYFNYREYERQ